MRNSILIMILKKKWPKQWIGVIKKLSKMLPQHSFLTIYKSFARPHLDYGDILYDQPTIKVFVKKLRLFNIMLPWPLILTSSVLCQLDNRGKQGKHYCSYNFQGESITEAKGSIFSDLYPLWSFKSFEYFAINFLNLFR